MRFAGERTFRLVARWTFSRARRVGTNNYKQVCGAIYVDSHTVCPYLRCHWQTRPPLNRSHPAPKIFPQEASCRGRFRPARPSSQNINGFCTPVSSHSPDPTIPCTTWARLVPAAYLVLASCIRLRKADGIIWLRRSSDAITMMSDLPGWPTCMCTVSSESVSYRLHPVCCTVKPLQSLGADPHLPRVSIVITLWFLKQFNQHVTSRYMLSSFRMYSARCPVGTLWKNPGVSFKM